MLGGGLEGGRGRLTEFTVRLAAAPSLHQSEHRVSGGSTNHRPACSCIQCRKAELGWPWQDSVQNIDRVWSPHWATSSPAAAAGASPGGDMRWWCAGVGSLQSAITLKVSTKHVRCSPPPAQWLFIVYH